MLRRVFAVLLAVVLAHAAHAQFIGIDRARQQAEERKEEAERQARIDREREQTKNMLGLYTKLLASGVFVCGREPQDFIDNDLRPASRGMLNVDLISFDVDTENQRVTGTIEGFEPRTAVFVGTQGCTLLPIGAEEVFFEPVDSATLLPPASEQNWPLGDRGAIRVANGVDKAKIESLLDTAFDDSKHKQPQRTRAIVVVYDGHIVAERYAPGFDALSRHISWSMGKSIQSALIGVMVEKGYLTVDDPAPIPEWHQLANDPRSEITIRNLMHMSGGLDWDRASPISGTAFTSQDDHSRVYFGAINVYDYSINTPLRYKPGAVWRYLNCDPLSLGYVMKLEAPKHGLDYLTFPQYGLFDRVGMRDMVLECDAWGNFIMTGFDYGTARDWARFGLLHLNDGVFAGDRVLPEGWVDFVTTPAPAAEGKNYGALFWLNQGGTYESLPKDMYYPAGHHSQHVFIFPSNNAVIVRLGHSVEGGFDEYFEPILAGILEALPGS